MRVRVVKRAAALSACVVIAAWTQFDSPLRLQPTSRLWVSGTSTVRSFECQAKSFAATVEANVPDAVAAVLAGELGVASAQINVPVQQLDCGNGTMNEHMLKALKAKDFKEVVFALNSYDLAKAAGGTHVTLHGALTLGGVARTITMDAEVKAGPNGSLIVTGKYPLRMTEFDLKPPKLMLGALKVNELVSVNFELLLKP